MNKDSYFNSSLASFFKDYIEIYEMQGRISDHLRYALHELDQYLVSIDYSEDFLSKDAYDGWTETLTDIGPSTLYKKKLYVRAFCKYMCEIGHVSHLGILPKNKNGNFIPYIFTESEMQSIFQASDEYRDCKKIFDSQAMVMPALLRLLYSTGIRIGEALRLCNKDVDFTRHVISLHYTKNKMDRLAPINQSLETVLKQYIHYRNLLPVKDVDAPDSLLFVKTDGSACGKNRVIIRYHRILSKAGVPVRQTNNRPRLHDIRHTACVHALTKLIKKGVDPYCSLPVLSTFMGHQGVAATEYYLRLTADMYPDLVNMDVSVTSSIKDVILKSLIEHGYEVI